MQTPLISRLPFGNFYGQFKKSVEIVGLQLTETAYLPNAVLPRHEHESAYFCFVVKGTYEETVAGKTRLRRPATLVTHPAGEVHSERFGTADGVCFNLELGPSWRERTRDWIQKLGQGTVFLDPKIVSLAAKIRGEFGRMDDVSPLAIEGLTLELLAETARGTRLEIGSGKPLWLKQAEDLIRARFREVLTLGDIAACVGRHPVHVARQFRRHYRCTVGDFIRRLRVQHACRRLARSDEPLVMIALDLGFSGQAHFSTLFRRQTGLSPTEYRHAFQSR
jgi:AraC family transcriptional regulator